MVYEPPLPLQGSVHLLLSSPNSLRTFACVPRLGSLPLLPLLNRLLDLLLREAEGVHRADRLDSDVLRIEWDPESLPNGRNAEHESLRYENASATYDTPLCALFSRPHMRLF
jgi:hypothetical protein